MRKILMSAAGLAGVVVLVLLVLSVFSAAPAQAAEVRYMSQHPLPRRLGGGFCYIDVPHVHDFGPSDPRMYRQVDGEFYFVGDPTPFDYQGPRTPYYGPHPVVEANVQLGQPVYCYLQGPHYHSYEPPPQASFELRGGAYWFTGTFEPAYYDQRPRYVAVNDAYAPIVYTRPVVDVSLAPPAFHGELVGGGPGWRGHAVVGGPMVSVGVVAAPPPPVQIGVGINLGGPVVVEHESHDDGRHGGWDHRGQHGGWRGAPPAQHGGWRGAPPAQHGGWRGAPGPQPHGGGWRGGQAAPTHQSGGWRGAPAPQQHGWHSVGNAPSRGGGGKPSHAGGGWKR
jgi:hypothetical protein